MNSHIAAVAAGILLFWLSLDHQPAVSIPPAPPPPPPPGPDPWPRIPDPSSDSYRDDSSQVKQ